MIKFILLNLLADLLLWIIATLPGPALEAGLNIK